MTPIDMIASLSFPQTNIPSRLRSIRNLSCVTLALALATPCLPAQEAPRKETLPPGPLIQKRAEDMSYWTVTQRVGNPTEQERQAAGSGVVQTTSYVKTGPVIHTVITDGQHRTWNLWLKDNVQIVVWPDQKNVGFAAKPTPGQYNPLYVNLASTDFPGFEWISPDNFKGIRSIMGKQCLVFQQVDSSDPKDLEKSNGISTAAVAAVDLETRLPVSLGNGYGVFIYEFHAPPKEPQVMPPAVQQFVQKEQERTQGVARLPGKPY